MANPNSPRETYRHLEIASTKNTDGSLELVVEQGEGGDPDIAVNVYDAKGELVMYLSPFNTDDRPVLRALTEGNLL